MAITTAPIQAMLYDSPHAQDRSWAGTRRISHGPAIRHQQPLRPSLQLGRDRRGPGRNVDRRCSVYPVDGRLSLSLGFAVLIRCGVIDQLIADTPSVWSARAASGSSLPLRKQPTFRSYIATALRRRRNPKRMPLPRRSTGLIGCSLPPSQRHRFG